jgi:hypothetical protein
MAILMGGKGGVAGVAGCASAWLEAATNATPLDSSPMNFKTRRRRFFMLDFS